MVCSKSWIENIPDWAIQAQWKAKFGKWNLMFPDVIPWETQHTSTKQIKHEYA